MKMTENAAYLKGLFEGYEISKDSKEGKIIAEMLNLIYDMADTISSLEEEISELQEYVEELDQDLGEVEEELFLADDDCCDGDCDDCECDCDEDYEGEETEYFEMECPSCGEMICFDESLCDGDVTCPACGETITDIEICDGNCDECDDEECKQQ